jgi:hypothetical protein
MCNGLGFALGWILKAFAASRGKKDKVAQL